MTLPFVSIVIASFNSERWIADCLRSLENQDYPKDRYEIIVVDSSTDRTGEIARRFNGVKLVRVEGYHIAPEKRNIGIRLARGELIAFIDSDAFADRKWLRNLVRPFADPEVGVVGGPNLTPRDADFREKVSGYLLGSSISSSAMSVRYRASEKPFFEADERHLISCNMAIRRESLEKVGAFREDMPACEENELCNRIGRIGYKMIYTVDAIVWHRRRPIFWPIIKRVYEYGRGRGIFSRTYPRSIKLVYLLPSVFTIGLLASPIVLFVRELLWPLVAVMLLYAALALYLGLGVALAERDPSYLLVIPIVLLPYHISYGLGFLRGLTIRLERHPPVVPIS